MEPKGFIHDMLDVKLLILYVMARVVYPVDLQKLYELAYQDDRFSYFDLAQAVPQMVASGHLEETEGDRYVITQKGREAGEVTEDAVAYAVAQRAQAAVERFNREVRRSSYVKTEVSKRESGDFSGLTQREMETYEKVFFENFANKEEAQAKLDEMALKHPITKDGVLTYLIRGQVFADELKALGKEVTLEKADDYFVQEVSGLKTEKTQQTVYIRRMLHVTHNLIGTLAGNTAYCKRQSFQRSFPK